jgi:CRISPR-associated protein Cmr6
MAKEGNMEYSSHNMHYIYNTEYFDYVMNKKNEKYVEDAGTKIVKFPFTGDDLSSYRNIEKTLDEQFKDLKEAGVKFSTIKLKTMYPGLLIGTGYQHQCGTDKSIVGGFSFDYVTGLPVIPGSTVKGMMRSYIPEDVPGDDIPEECKSAEDKEHEALWEMISDIRGFTKKKLNMKDFIKAVFETDNIFLGAYPDVQEGKDVFASEYITPHNEPTQDPVPLPMIKVKGEVEYHFMFVLYDYKDENGNVIVSADEIEALFEGLLLRGGIGAKTNVGFGQWKSVPKKDKDKSKAKVIERRTVLISRYDSVKNKAYFGSDATEFISYENVGKDKKGNDYKGRIDLKVTGFVKVCKKKDENGVVAWFLDEG